MLELWPAVLATVLEAALLVLAAEAERALPLQAVVAAVATRTKETRTDRYIFPTCC